MKSLVALAVLVSSPLVAQTATMPAAVAPAAPATTSAPAAASSATTTAAGGTAVAAAKPKLICEQMDTMGTRLGGHKVCMTREQWRDQQRQDRMAVDHAQLGRGNTGN